MTDEEKIQIHSEIQERMDAIARKYVKEFHDRHEGCYNEDARIHEGDMFHFTMSYTIMGDYCTDYFSLPTSYLSNKNWVDDEEKRIIKLAKERKKQERKLREREEREKTEEERALYKELKKKFER